MALKPMMQSFEMSWTNHDAWSETYIGVWRLVNEILPDSFQEQRAQDSSLCRLALVGSHQLMELALKALLRESGVSEVKLRRSSFYVAIGDLAEKASGLALPLTEEPFRSTEKLRKKRNKTIHGQKTSVSVEMARSALRSGTEGTRALYKHFDCKFPYQHILDKHPMPNSEPFSENSFEKID